MILSLDGWVARLDQHFRQLAAARQQSGFPIFALEHGLTADELGDVANQLRTRLANRLRLAPHWLLWVIYATEQGYAYDGHEYWVSFEENTPSWADNASARQLRGYFEKFQATYHGVVPTGPWAGWFRNIAWPITHAILPKYLQIQFARTLHEASYQLARLPALTPAAAGKALANAAWNATSRFHEFLEQEELAGRIVLALLNQGVAADQSPIYQPTLTRIVADLERVRSASEWLKHARQVVADRFRGVARGNDAARLRDGQQARLSEAPNPNIRPALTLRRSGAARWTAVLDIPSFAPIAQLQPDLAGFLRGTRCRVAGVSEDFLPRGWLLGGDQRRVLRQWPNPNQPIVQFERRHDLLNTLLHKDCRIGPGPTWLFRAGPDGIAHEIAGRLVRPGQHYVLVSTKPLAKLPAFSQPATIECGGVFGATFDVPEAVSHNFSRDLHDLGLEIARSVRLWPAGLPAVRWDGEGHGEWLSTESPCFGIVHDHAVDAYLLNLDGGPELRIAGQRAGQPVFIRLPPLQPGRHVLRVQARRLGVSLSAQALKELEGKVELAVRDPAPWLPATTAHAGLSLIVDPPDPSLDSFWEGDGVITVAGPDGHSVDCTLTLHRRDGTLVLDESVGTFDLPLKPAAWRKRLQEFRGQPARTWQYLDAAAGTLTIDGGELGRFAVTLERERRPLRWVCIQDQHQTRVRLLDDTGVDTPPLADFYPLGHPDSPEVLSPEASQGGLVVAEPGGLFAARQDTHKDVLVISSAHGKLTLTQLLIEPRLKPIADDAQLAGLFYLTERWVNARLAGPLARERRDHVARAFVATINRQLCGERWVECRNALAASPNSEPAMERLVQAVGNKSFAVVVRRGSAQFGTDQVARAKWFADLAGRYAVSSDEWLCTFALALAIAPGQAREHFRDRFEPLLRQARGAPVLCRAAQLAVLVAEVASAAPVTA
ncbi:MAG: hypothetical protein AB7G07_09075 [Bauldia sp.]